MPKKSRSKETVEQILLDITGATGFRDMRTNKVRKVKVKDETDIFEDFWSESNNDQGKDIK